MSKISRIKIKSPDNIDIFTIVKAYLLKQISDELYIYIDDRIYDPNINENIDKILTIMNNFGIYIDKVIRYTEYYNIVRIYIHRLIKFNNIQILTEHGNPKKDIYLNDYKLFANNYDALEISLISNKNSDFNYVIYDTNKYDEIFLLLIIDYSEKVSYIPTNNIYMALNNTIKNILTDKLCITAYPEPVLFDITESINNYLSDINKLNILSIVNIPIECMYNIGMENIINIIKNSESIYNYIISTTKCIDEIKNNTVCFIENPINVILSNSKTINIYNNVININKRLFIENKDDIKFTSEGSKIKLKYGGMIHIKNQDDIMYGKLLSKSKKKKKISTHWIPHNKPINEICFILEDSKKIVGIYSNFDISTKYFINIYNNIYMFKFNDNPLEYSSLILLNNSKN